jgi:peptide/nickel transport system substrate-binding protein
MELCIDKEATVETATRGDGIPVYSPVAPASWAYQPSIPHPARDVAAARALIEGEGWTPGADGIYVRDGRRLATEVLVRSDISERVRFVDLVAAQVKDCGIELTVSPADVRTVLGPVLEYPHIAAGRTEPFDAIFFGWFSGTDPDQPLFHSREISSEARPDAINAMGYSNPDVDRLLDAGIATSDQRERARIYRDLQLLLADDQPVLFAWAPRIREVLSAGVGLTTGEIDRSSLNWWWQPEKLIVRATTTE